MSTVEQLSVQSSLPIGRAGKVTSPPEKTSSEDLMHVAGRATATQAYDLTSAGASAAVDWTLTVMGEAITITTDATPTIPEITAALKAAAEANSITNGYATYALSTDGSADDTLTITARKPGVPLTCSLTTTGTGTFVDEGGTSPSEATLVSYGVPIYGVVDGTYGVLVATPTNPNEANLDAFRGISVYVQNNAVQAVNATSPVGYPESTRVEILRTGQIIVAGGDNATKGLPVYIGVSADSETNEFFTASGGSRNLLADAEWVGPNKIELRRGL